MPVRIVFRGLMLFQFPESGPDAKKLVAWLINSDAAAGGAKAASAGQSRGGPHDHRAEIQIVTGAAGGNELTPIDLRPGVTVDIAISNGKPITRLKSFDDHVADLETIIAKGTDAVRNAGRVQPNRRFVQNKVTVDRGLVRVKDVMAWDEGGYPLSGGSGNGNRASAPVRVKFMGSSVEGHMASEVIVEVDDAVGVQLRSNDKALNGSRKGVPRPNHRHVPPNACQILVTNYEPPGDKPTPWGLDFQWLFEAAGYNAANLAGAEFSAWETSAQQYDAHLFTAERVMLGGPHNTIGRPFPYVVSTGSITSLQPLTSPLNPPVCPFAITTLPLDQTFAAERTAATMKTMAAKAPAKAAGKTAKVTGKAAEAKRAGKAAAKKTKTPAKKKSKKR